MIPSQKITKQNAIKHFFFSADEARNLKSYGEFPESVKINETVDFVGGDNDDDIEFDEVDSDDSGSDDNLGDDIDHI